MKKIAQAIIMTAVALFASMAQAAGFPWYSLMGMHERAAADIGKSLGYHVHVFPQETDNGEKAPRNSVAFIDPKDSKTMQGIKSGDWNVIDDLINTAPVFIDNGLFANDGERVIVNSSGIERMFGMKAGQKDFMRAFSKSNRLPQAKLRGKIDDGPGAPVDIYVIDDETMNFSVIFHVRNKKILAAIAENKKKPDPHAAAGMGGVPPLAGSMPSYGQAANMPTKDDMYAMMEESAAQLEALGQKEAAAEIRASIQQQKQMMEQYGDRIEAAKRRVGITGGAPATGRNGGSAAGAWDFPAPSQGNPPRGGTPAPKPGKPKLDADGWEILDD